MSKRYLILLIFTAILAAGCLGGTQANIMVFSPDDGAEIDTNEVTLSYAIEADSNPVTALLIVDGETVQSHDLEAGESATLNHQVYRDPGATVDWRVETRSGDEVITETARTFQITDTLSPVQITFNKPPNGTEVDSPVVFDYNVTTPAPATFEILINDEIKSYRTFSEGTTHYQDSLDLEPGQYTWEARLLTSRSGRQHSINDKMLKVTDRTVMDIQAVGYAGSRDMIEAGEEIGLMASLWLGESATYEVVINETVEDRGSLEPGTQRIDYFETIEAVGSYDWQIVIETNSGETFESATRTFQVN